MPFPTTVQRTEFQLAVLRLISGGLAIGMVMAGIFGEFDPEWVQNLILIASIGCALFTTSLAWLHGRNIAVVRAVLVAIMVTVFVGGLTIQPAPLGTLTGFVFLGVAVGVAAYEKLLPAIVLSLAAVTFGVLSIAVKSSVPEAGTGVFLAVAAACLFAVFGFRRVAASATADAVADSLIDPLTGVTNRRGLTLGAELLRAIAERSDQKLGCLIMDLDHFKAVNDDHGHEVGDNVLVAVARGIQSVTRPHDLFVRVGGEEFALFTVVSSTRELTQIAERVRHAVEGLELDAPVTISVGGALRDPAAPLRLEDLMKAADRQLYAAKAAGRNIVRVAGVSVGRTVS